MIWTHKDLYEGFIAEAGKFNIDGELGRASFQDFEIAHFLNSAYKKVISEKLNSYDQLWLPREARKEAMTAGSGLSGKSMDAGVINNDSQLLSEFGSLIKSFFVAEAAYHLVTQSSSTMAYFPIPKGTDLKPLRLLAVTMTSCVSTENPMPSSWAPNDQDYTSKRTYTHVQLRPMTALDTVKNNNLFLNSDDLAYRYYSVSLRSYILPTATTATMSTEYFVEVSKNRMGGWLWITGYGIQHPAKISSSTLKAETGIEVSFGEEIILAASAMADNSLKRKITPD